MKATGLPSSTPTLESEKVLSISVNWRKSLPSLRIDQRFFNPSRSLSNTMRVPSGVNPLRVSLAVFEVKRTASPPVAAARQRSPRQLKTRIVPSGESAGKRGRSTVAALTNDEIKAGSVIATIRDKGKEPAARGSESNSRCMLLSSPV